MDSGLTELGKRQARLAGRALTGYRINRCYCSDAGRVRQTVAQIKSLNPYLEPQTDIRLRELDYGAWEGMYQHEIEGAYPELFEVYIKDPAKFKSPNGESFRDLQQRFGSFLNELKPSDDENILLVSRP